MCKKMLLSKQRCLPFEIVRTLCNVFKTSRSVLSGLKPRGTAEWFKPDKTRAASFLNGFKNIPGKARVNRVHNNYALLAYEKNTTY